MISKKVHDELMSVRRVLNYLPASPSTEYGWTPHECQIFWVALDRYPRGPWTTIAEFIGTKSTRQAMTHGQKLRQKLKRWITRLRRNPAARSLMNGDSVTTDFTTTTGVRISADLSINVTVSGPLSRADIPVGHPGRPSQSLSMNSPTPLYPIASQRVDATLFVPGDVGQQLQPATETRTVPDTVQVEDNSSTNSRSPEAAASRSSTSLRMLFESSTTARSTATAAIQFDETKHDELAMPHPISEVAMPVRNLLEELADVLWNDHRPGCAQVTPAMTNQAQI
ncbi:unnamed protein product [Phytophthora fragariaefolia]|uniref:Unnamed protein product n=1 Tax=Phytophthora fragariaefolia TaxID=1490495 RepID=A0A9W7D6H9_9STRA|nr:unnamed protein product [Phytophthora fragariaefolia]